MPWRFCVRQKRLDIDGIYAISNMSKYHFRAPIIMMYRESRYGGRSVRICIMARPITICFIISRRKTNRAFEWYDAVNDESVLRLPLKWLNRNNSPFPALYIAHGWCFISPLMALAGLIISYDGTVTISPQCIFIIAIADDNTAA